MGCSGRAKLAVYTMNRLTAVTNHLRTAALPTEVVNAPVGAGGYEDEYRIPGVLPAPCVLRAACVCCVAARCLHDLGMERRKTPLH